MSPVENLSLVLGTGFSSGLNVYATVATLGVLQRFGVIHLPEKLQVLSHPVVLGVALALYAVEVYSPRKRCSPQTLPLPSKRLTPT